MRVSVLVLMGLFGTWTGVFAQDLVKVGYIEFPPVFYTEGGVAKGYLNDLTSEVLTKAGYKPEFASYPTKRMAAMVADGSLSLWVGLTTLPEFDGTTLVGPTPVTAIHLRAYTLGSRSPIKAKEDLSGKAVILLPGYSYGGWLDYLNDKANNVRPIMAKDHADALKLLSRGLGDYLLDYEQPITETLKVTPVADLKWNDISSFNAHFVVSKKTKNAEKLLADLEATYKKLSKK